MVLKIFALHWKRESALYHILLNFYIQKESTLHVKDYLTALAIPSFSARISNLCLFNMNNRHPETGRKKNPASREEFDFCWICAF